MSCAVCLCLLTRARNGLVAVVVVVVLPPPTPPSISSRLFLLVVLNAKEGEYGDEEEKGILNSPSGDDGDGDGLLGVWRSAPRDLDGRRAVGGGFADTDGEPGE